MRSARRFTRPRGPAYTDKWRWFLPLDKFPPLHPEEPRIAGYFYDWLRHPDNDAYWQQWSIRERWSSITVPALNFDGWYDIFLNGAIENFAGMRKQGGSAIARDGQRLVIGPWVHISWQRRVGQIDFGPEAVEPDAGAHAALVRLLAEGNSERRGQGSARQGVRHGSEHVAQRERLAD